MKSLAHPLLQGPPLEERAYQRNVAAACLRESTLAVLPTGLGKTVIALQVMLGAARTGAGADDGADTSAGGAARHVPVP